MLRVSAMVRTESLPDAYRRLLFGSSIEVVLASVALITQLFVFAPLRGELSLVEALFGPAPPVLAVYFTLLILWDVCYRIGTAWWASVVSLWRSVRYRFSPTTARALRRSDLEIIAFAAAQLLFPFVAGRSVIVAVIVGHVVAV